MPLFGLFKKPTQERLQRVLRAMDTLIMNEQVKDIERDVQLDHEHDHIREAVANAKLLASKRKMDPELSAVVAALQNIGRMVTGKSEGHAEAGYLPAKQLLARLGCFADKEIEQIAVAVRNHSRKAEKDAPLDELAKDADIYARYLQGQEFRRPADLDRLNKLRAELEF